VVKDLATKKPVTVSLSDDSTIRKLPPMMAMFLARRFNPNYKPAAGAAGAQGNGGGARSEGRPGGGGGNAAAGGGWSRGAGAGAGAGGPGGGGGMRSGDISQVLDRAPKISLTDLKPGDALVVSGVALGEDHTKVLANNLIAGVEPILQSAPQGQGNIGGDWGLSGDITPPQ
jgi:hypothetical protein